MQKIQPLKIAAKFSPPKIALVYARGNESYIHEFPLDPNDLTEPSESILEILDTFHPGYLNYVSQARLIKVIDIIKSNNEQTDNLTKYNKYIDEVELYSSDGFSSNEENLDYGAIDDAIKHSSDEDLY